MSPAETESTLKEKESDLVVWRAPSRPFKRRDRQFYVTVIAIAAIVGLVLFLVEGFMPVVLLISFVFLFYVMNTVEPETIEYKITNLGIKIGNSSIDWENMARFWFSKRFDSELLVVETFSLPGRMEYVIDPKTKAELKKTIAKYIPEEEVPPSNIDRMSNWFSAKLPGNN